MLKYYDYENQVLGLKNMYYKISEQACTQNNKQTTNTYK